MIIINVVKNRERNVLIIPFWMLLVVVARERFREVIVLGPVFSNQVWSMVIVAMVWLSFRKV